MRRVVVTGMGAVTPIGIGVDTFWENVKKKTLGFGEITRFDTTAVSYTHLDGPVAQLVRAPPCHGGGHGFESRLGRLWDLSSAGRASALQAEGHRFEPCRSHLTWMDSRVAKGDRL